VSWNMVSAGHVTSVGETVLGGLFPNYAGRDMLVRVSVPAAVAANVFDVLVYSTDTPMTQAQPMVNEATLDVTGQIYQPISNGYTAQVLSITGAATTDAYLPNVPAPARVMLAYTQTGAGTVTATIRTLTDYTGSSAQSVQFDSTLLTTTAAGAAFASAQYGVWPTAATFVRFSVPAGVTLSGIRLTVISGVQ